MFYILLWAVSSLEVSSGMDESVTTISSGSGSGSDNHSDSEASTIAYVYVGAGLSLLFVYSVTAYMSWPAVRHRTGWPLLLLALALIFPPLFFIVLFYVILLVAFSPSLQQDVTEIVIVPARPRVTSQEERRNLKK